VSQPSPEIARAASVLRAGGLVAFPTETVYGLGADATNADAVRRLYRVKGRPPTHPVIVHLGTADAVDDYTVDVPDSARALAAAFWPGPLTLVLRRRPGTIADEVTGGRATVAVRVPGHDVALALLGAFGGAVAAPSANRFGKVSPTRAEHVRSDLGAEVDLVLDAGPCAVGVESTIVDATGTALRVVRPGGVTDAQLAAVAGFRLPHAAEGDVAAPGTLPTHYAPAARVELVTHAGLAPRARALIRKGHRVGVLAMTANEPAAELPAETLVLSRPNDVDQFARELYARLRDADAAGVDVVLVVAPPQVGVGAAVVDRLRRAARTNESAAGSVP
jgi:L-threonylcarbamoyladenylate synthase